VLSISVVLVVISEFGLDHTAPLTELLHPEEKPIKDTELNKELFHHLHGFNICTFADALESERHTYEHFLFVTVTGQPIKPQILVGSVGGKLT
jgi:hypothetical protein